MKKTSWRLVRNALLALFAILFVVLAVWMAYGDVDGNSKLAGIVSLFVGIPMLAATVVQWFPTAVRRTPSAPDSADDLANTVQAQWYEEARVRGLRDPKVLPLTWSTGRMDGKFDETTRQLADGYREVRSGRLVVLGEPGSGKTVLAILLTLGLLNSRSTGSAVPVLLAASSWDPIQESMDDWVIRTLATSYYNGQQDIPRTLLDHGLLLPILDGLDEIPESARRSAVQGINEAIGADRPVVVTCRSAEYDDVIEGGAPMLRHTPVVRVTPVAIADVIAYLKEVPSWPRGTSWEAVFDDLRQWPDGPLAVALSTPLMVSLARGIYQRCGGDPAELLDAKKFDSRHKVEDYLVDRIIDAAYAPDLLRSGDPATGSASGWDAAKARRWLTFLARYLHQHRERDLAWWQLSDRLMSPWMAPGIGIGLSAALMLTVSVGITAINSDDNFSTVDALLGIGAVVGTVVAVLGTVLWYGAVGCAPGRMALVIRGSLGRLRRGFASGTALVAILAVPVLLVAAVATFIGRISNSGSDSNFSGIKFLAVLLMVVVALACVVGFAVAAHNWFNALPERSAQASPFSFVQQDRRSSLVGALAAGVVAGLTMFPVFSVALLTGETVGQGIAGGLGETGTTQFTDATTLVDESRIRTIWFAVILAGVGVALLVLLTRAWPRFVLARVVLAGRGHLPWRLLTFLADARRRDLLRQSGGMYQFRHVRLQERLASQSGVAATGPRRPAPTPITAVRRQRIIAVAAALVIVSSTAVTLSTFNYLRCDSPLSRSADVDRVRSFTNSGSLCVGIISESEWDRLSRSYPVVDRLRKGNGDLPKGNNEVTVAVLGALPAPGFGMSAVMLHQFDGVVLAQQESKRLGQPVRVVLVDTGPVPDINKSFALERAESLDGRPGVKELTVVDLDVARRDPGGYNPNMYHRVVPLFFTSEFDYTFDNRLSMSSLGARTLFDQQQISSLMDRFIRYRLETKAENSLSLGNDYSWPDNVGLMACAGVKNPVFWLEKLEVGKFGQQNPNALMNACGTNNVRLVVTDNSLVEYFRNFPAHKFPNLTVYYPVVEKTLTARSCKEVAASIPGYRVDACDDMETEFSYQATLNAADRGNIVVHLMRAEQDQWISMPFQR